MSVKPQVSIHIGDILSLRDWDHRFRTWGFESAVDDDSIVIFSDEKDLKKAFKENGFDYKTLEYVGKSKKVTWPEDSLKSIISLDVDKELWPKDPSKGSPVDVLMKLNYEILGRTGKFSRLFEGLEEETPTKVWTKEEVIDLINKSDMAVYRGIKRLTTFQTPDERTTGKVTDLNGKGFNKFDAPFMTSLANLIEGGAKLSQRQMEAARRILKKYAGQLVRFANGELA